MIQKTILLLFSIFVKFLALGFKIDATHVCFFPLAFGAGTVPPIWGWVKSVSY